MAQDFLRKIKKVLAIRNDRLGETLLVIPALRAIKENLPSVNLTFICNPYFKELAEFIEYVDQIITWDNKKHRFKEVWEFSLYLRKQKFDLCVIFNPSKESNIISFLAGIPIRLGYARKWDFLLTHKIEDKKYLGLKHEIDYNLELLAVLGITTEDKSLSLKLPEIQLPYNLEDYPNLVVIHPWTSDPQKQWPVENFKEVAEKLSENKDLKVVIVGGKEEELKSNLYFSQNKNILNLTGKTTLKELAYILKKAKLLITTDSGPMHLASCLNRPILAIFRNDIPAKSPLRWGPKSSVSIVIQKPNLSEITSQEVINKVKEIILS